MEIFSSAELLDRINEVIEYLSENEDLYYIALEVAQQLRDEVTQVVPNVDEDE